MKRWLRRALLWLVSLLLVVFVTVPAVGCALSAPTWKGPVTEHFDGQKFVTPGAPKHNSVSFESLPTFFKWQRERQPSKWPAFHDDAPGRPPPQQVAMGAMRVTFINHATTLIQVDGVNVLTDPIYAERASPFAFAGPKRVRPPGIRFVDLPRIDAVVLSHNHYDHMDVATLQKIQSTWPKVQIFAGLGNRAFLESKGLTNVSELDWWDTREVGGLTIHSVPNQHFSNRGLFDSDGTLWTAWVFDGSRGRAYFGGDTAMGPHFAMVSEKLGPMRLAVLPVGAYKPEWFMSPIHMSPKEAVQAAIDLHAGVSIPMHYGTFNLADDAELEPVDVLATELQSHPDVHFEVLGFGQGLDVPELTP